LVFTLNTDEYTVSHRTQTSSFSAPLLNNILLSIAVCVIFQVVLVDGCFDVCKKANEIRTITEQIDKDPFYHQDNLVPEKVNKKKKKNKK
jgi:hypothetical protein